MMPTGKESKMIDATKISTDIDVVEQIKVFKCLPRDEDIAVLLGITKAAISEVRHGRAKLGHLPRLKALSIFGYEFAEKALLAIETGEFHQLIEKAPISTTQQAKPG